MKIEQLTLHQFRNYDTLSLPLTDRLTILTGENAQGKTNILEAIFLLSVAKSHRTKHDQDLIQMNQSFATISGIVQQRHYQTQLELQIQQRGKVAKVNRLEQARLSDFVGKLNVVLFAPEDMQLIKGMPSLRRQFLDTEISQVHPIYLSELVQYNKLLKQRNTYLKNARQTNQFDPLYFEILTEQFVDKAVQIIQYRLTFIEQLMAYAQPIHYELSNKRDELRLEYISSSQKLDYTQMETLKKQLMTLFQHSMSREKEQAVTLYGPHRDDLAIYINDVKAQLYGSQGQQRTIVLSLKLAEIEFIHSITNEYPVLLLDDVLSELDDQRQHILMKHIENKVQTILTTASIQGIDLTRLKHPTVWYVRNGTIEKGE